MAQQNTYLDTFIQSANDEQIAFYEATVTGEPVTEVDAMREIAFANATAEDLGGVEGGYWFDQITAKINLMKVVEDELAHDVVVKAGALQTDARNSLITSASVGLVVLAIAGAIAFYVAQSIRKPLIEVVAKLRSLREGGVASVQGGMAALASGDLTVDAQAGTATIRALPR